MDKVDLFHNLRVKFNELSLREYLIVEETTRELEQQIVQLKKDVIENESDCANCGLRQENEELKKEVLEVRQHLDLTEREWGKDTTKLIHFKTQLTKAKEIIALGLRVCETSSIEYMNLYQKQAEQFIREIKENEIKDC